MATVRWLGLAQDIQQITTYTITGTWAANDTATFTINDKSLILTVGTDVAVADIAAEIAAMINATSDTFDLRGVPDETRNFGGQEFPEWTEVKASSSGAVLTLKCTAGIPVTITGTEVTAGSGSVGSPTTVQAATGKNFFNDAANWEGGSVPSAGDVILFDQGSVDVLYGLNESGTINNLNLIKTSGYTGNIGLLPVHGTGSSAYIEYRTRYLYLPNSSGSQSFQIGDITSLRTPGGRMYIDLGAGTTSSLFIEVFDALDRDSTGHYVQFVRGKKIELKVHSGGVAFGIDEAVSTASEFLSFFADGDSKVHMGPYTQMNSGSSVVVAGNAEVLQDGNVADSTVDFTVHSGTLISHVSSIDVLSCRGGTTVINNASVTSAAVYGGAVLSEGNLFATISAITVYRGATLNHPTDMLAFSSGIDFSGCRPSDVAWNPPLHKTWTPSAI